MLALSSQGDVSVVTQDEKSKQTKETRFVLVFVCHEIQTSPCTRAMSQVSNGKKYLYLVKHSSKLWQGVFRPLSFHGKGMVVLEGKYLFRHRAFSAYTWEWVDGVSNWITGLVSTFKDHYVGRNWVHPTLCHHMQPHKRLPSDQYKTRRNRILQIVEHTHGLYFLFSSIHVQRPEGR